MAEYESNPMVTFRGSDFLRETPSGKAEIWRLASDEEICVPKSLTARSPDGFLILPEWFAKKEGLNP